MNKNLFVNLIDKLFISACLFLTIFAWLNFYTRSIWTSFVLSLIFSSACLFILFYLISMKNDKKYKTKNRIIDIEENFLAFRLLTKKQQQDFILNLLKSLNPTRSNDMIFYSANSKKNAIIIATDIAELTENDFFNIVQKVRNLDIDEIEIICNSVAKFNHKILTTKNFTFTNKESFYENYLKKFDIYPNTNDIQKPSKKIKFTEILSNLFLPHKAKSYFICGLVLIFSSIIIPYHAYYVIVGSTLLLFAAICKIKKSIPN